MTLIAPGGRRPPQPPRQPQPSRPSRVPVAPRSGQDAPLIGLALAPPAGQQFETTVTAARLSGSARFGAALLLIIGLLLQRTVLPLVPWGPADLVTVLVVCWGSTRARSPGASVASGSGWRPMPFPTMRSDASRPCSASSATCAA